MSQVFSEVSAFLHIFKMDLLKESREIGRKGAIDDAFEEKRRTILVKNALDAGGNGHRAGGI